MAAKEAQSKTFRPAEDLDRLTVLIHGWPNLRAEHRLAALDLYRLAAADPHVETDYAELMARWECGQSSVRRRLVTLEARSLLHWRTAAGRLVIDLADPAHAERPGPLRPARPPRVTAGGQRQPGLFDAAEPAPRLAVYCGPEPEPVPDAREAEPVPDVPTTGTGCAHPEPVPDPPAGPHGDPLARGTTNSNVRAFVSKTYVTSDADQVSFDAVRRLSVHIAARLWGRDPPKPDPEISWQIVRLAYLAIVWYGTDLLEAALDVTHEKRRGQLKYLKGVIANMVATRNRAEESDAATAAAKAEFWARYDTLRKDRGPWARNGTHEQRE